MKEQLIKRIQENLSPNLLRPEYQKIYSNKLHPHFGHCYVASEAAYHLFCKDEGYIPQVMHIDENTTHWYLRKGDDIVDVTKAQFPFDLDYSLGRGCGFLTKKPSKRTQWLINKLTVKKK